MSFIVLSFNGITLLFFFFLQKFMMKIGEIDWGLVVIEIESACMTYLLLLCIVL